MLLQMKSSATYEWHASLSRLYESAFVVTWQLLYYQLKAWSSNRTNSLPLLLAIPASSYLASLLEGNALTCKMRLDSFQVEQPGVWAFPL